MTSAGLINCESFESGDEEVAEEDDIIPAVLLAARYAAQLVRIVITLNR